MKSEARNQEPKWLSPKEEELMRYSSKQDEIVDIQDENTTCYCDKLQGQSVSNENTKNLNEDVVASSPIIDFVSMLFSLSASMLMLLACHVIKRTMMSYDELENKNMLNVLQPCE